MIVEKMTSSHQCLVYVVCVCMFWTAVEYKHGSDSVEEDLLPLQFKVNKNTMILIFFR